MLLEGPAQPPVNLSTLSRSTRSVDLVGLAQALVFAFRVWVWPNESRGVVLEWRSSVSWSSAEVSEFRAQDMEPVSSPFQLSL
jgi:hypothetical protein